MEMGTGADSSLIGSVEEMQGNFALARDIIESCMEQRQANKERKNQIIREVHRKK